MVMETLDFPRTLNSFIMNTRYDPRIGDGPLLAGLLDRPQRSRRKSQNVFLRRMTLSPMISDVKTLQKTRLLNNFDFVFWICHQGFEFFDETGLEEFMIHIQSVHPPSFFMIVNF